MKKLLMIFSLVVALAACTKQQPTSADSGPDIESTFFGGVTFNLTPDSALARLYAQGFRDAATAEQDHHFDTVPDNAGAVILLKILVPADSTGYSFKGMKWGNVQLQCDNKGLFCITMHSKEAPRAEVMEQYKKLLKTLLGEYPMEETVVGQSSIEGQAVNVQGHRYRHGGEQIQIYQNPNDSISSISLSFTQLLN